MSLSTAFKSVKTNVIKYLPKAAGVAALGVCAYDAHIVGKLQADVYAKSKDADACMETYSNTRYLSTPSMTVSKMKDSVHNFEVDSNFRHFFNSGIGYFKGFIGMLMDNVVPFGLGLGALLGKGKWAKGSAIGLGIYAGISFFKDVLGFGHYNDLNQKF